LTMKGSVANILQRFAGIAAAFAKPSDIFSRPPPPASEGATGSRADFGVAVGERRDRRGRAQDQ
jgi:hypothetical protein